MLTAGGGYGLHLDGASKNGVLRNSRIHDTGNDGRGMGEGVCVGTANSLTDRSDDAQILNNVIGPDVGGESVDIKANITVTP